MESKALKTVDEIPMVHNAMQYLMATYGVFKKSNSVIESGLTRYENLAYWVTEKTGNVLAATKIDKPLKELDKMAANSIAEANNRIIAIKTNVDQARSTAQQKAEEIRNGVKQIRAQAYETVESVLDVVEKKFEPIILPPAKNVERSPDHSLVMSLRRLFDVYYRLTAGTVQFSVEGLQSINTDVFTKMVSPQEIYHRFIIIRNETFIDFNAEEIKTTYLRNPKLLFPDKMLIYGGRLVFKTIAVTNKRIQQLLEDLYLAFGNKYLISVKDFFGQLLWTKNYKDVVVFCMEESRRAIETMQSKSKILEKSQIVKFISNWLLHQEQLLAD